MQVEQCPKESLNMALPRVGSLQTCTISEKHYGVGQDIPNEWYPSKRELQRETKTHRMLCEGEERN